MKIYLLRLNSKPGDPVDICWVDMFLLCVKCHSSKLTSALGWCSITKNKQNNLKVVS